MKGYQELLVWQKAMELVESVYRLTQGLPSDERFGLTSQIRRAAVSIPSNIAEGQSRNSPGEFRQFLGIACGSLAELETQLLLCLRLNFLTEDQFKNPYELANEVGRMLKGLLRSLTPTN